MKCYLHVEAEISKEEVIEITKLLLEVAKEEQRGEKEMEKKRVKIIKEQKKEKAKRSKKK